MTRILHKIRKRLTPPSSALLAAATIVLCCQPHQRTGAQSMNSPAQKTPLSCRAIAIPNGVNLYALRIELSNSSDQPLQLSTSQPFTTFSILASAAGQPLTVHKAALNIPLNPVTLHLPPHATLELPTPIKLLLAEGATPSTDRFTWTLPHNPRTLALQIKLDLPAPFNTTGPIIFP